MGNINGLFVRQHPLWPANAPEAAFLCADPTRRAVRRPVLSRGGDPLAAATVAAQPQVLVVGPSRSVEQFALGRRPVGRPPRGFGLSRIRIQVGEALLDHHRVLDTRNDPLWPATGRARLDFDAEDPLQVLRLRPLAARRSAGVGSSTFSLAPPWRPRPRLAGVTRERCLLFGANTPCKRVSLTRGVAPAPPAGR